MKRLPRKLLWLAVFTVVYCLPWLIVHMNAPQTVALDKLERADAVLVFGALVRDGAISPLQRERLLAAKQILDAGKAERIVVSNNMAAAKAMYQYLLQQGVPAQNLGIDGHADKTPDTCRNEFAEFGSRRRLIFVSQRYHLTRIHYQCAGLGVAGQLFPADQLGIIDRSQTPWWTTLRVRGYRYLREAGLTWLVFIGYYR